MRRPRTDPALTCRPGADPALIRRRVIGPVARLVVVLRPVVRRRLRSRGLRRAGVATDRGEGQPIEAEQFGAGLRGVPLRPSTGRGRRGGWRGYADHPGDPERGDTGGQPPGGGPWRAP